MTHKKNTTLVKFCIMLFCILAAMATKAQLFIKVTVLPPYWSHITDFASHPQQIMIVVQNGSSTAVDVQLRGTLTGDNGVTIAVNKNYRSATALHLGPLQTRNLNGNDINALFDFNQLVYSGITRNQLITQGSLPEGNYQVCVQAFDYHTNTPLTEDNCSNSFPISSVEPPYIIKPADGDNIMPVGGSQNFVLTWSTPAGAPPATQYIVTMAEVLDNRSPENALQTATQPVFFQQTVTASNVLLYGPAQRALTAGRRYAVQVQAVDPTNTVTFRNNGISQAVGFVYGMQENPAVIPVDEQVTCSCQVPLPADKQPVNQSIATGTIIKAGNFNVTVLTLVRNNDNTINGTGKVSLPLANSSYIPVGVSFSGIQINASNQLISGVFAAQVKSDVNFLPSVPSPNPSLIPFTQQDVTNLSNYIDNNKANTVSQLQNTASNAVFQLPLGIDKQVGGSPVTVEITALYITPQQATMDAVTVINTPDDATVSNIALGAKNVCVNPSDLCGDAKLYLADDVVLPSINLTLKGASNNGGGTYIVIDKGGFKNMQIVATYALPQSVVVLKSDGASPVVAQVTATTDQGWGDWIANVTMPDFELTGAPDLKFSVPNVFYDHSDFQNPPGLPAVFHSSDPSETDINTSATTWHGLFMPSLSIGLPPVISSSSANLNIQGSNFIYDNHGFTGLVSAVNPLAIGDGSLGGWYASIDAVNIEIFKSGFKNGALAGKLVLPPSGSNVTDPSNQLNYNCLLTVPQGGKTQFSFSVQPKAGLNFNQMYMVLNLDNSSNIQVTYTAGSTPVASAELNGSLSVDTKKFGIAAGAASMLLPSVQFQHFKLMTTAPYIDGGVQIGMGQGNGGQAFNSNSSGTDWAYNSPIMSGPSNYNVETRDEDVFYDDPVAQFSVGGFTAQLASVTPSINGGLFGLDFNVNLNLLGSDLSWGCKANTVFTLGANLAYQNGRIVCTGAGTKLKDLSFDASAKLGPVGISGGAKYFNTAALGEGFVGVVDVNVVSVLNLAMRVRFGYKPDNGGYNYFDLNALVDFGDAGIQMINPVYLYGFGGGVAFNENIQVSNPTISGQSSLDNMKDGSVDQLLGYSPGGVTFVPDKGKFVLQASVMFGLVPRSTLDCDASLTAVIDYQHGGLVDLNFDGGARVMARPGEYGPAGAKDAVGAGHINVNYDFVNNIFDLNSTVDMGVPNITINDAMNAHASLQIHMDSKDFWVYCGTLADRNTINIAKVPPIHPDYVFKGTSYFEMGTKIDDIPPLPASVGGVDISSLSGQVAADPNRADLARTHSGIVFGATADFDWTQQYLIFYGRLHAGLGFDLTLQQLSGDCAATMGANGWYAKGQAYFGATADIGIDVDLVFIHGHYSVLSGGVAAVIQAQLPNPTWVKGDLFGEYSILDGAVSGNMHYQFEIGEKATSCGNNPADVIGGVKLIADIAPNGGSTGVEITTVPVVSFNIKRKQFDFTEIKDDGSKVVHHFLFDNSCLTYTLNNQQVVFVNQDDYSVYYEPTALLNPNTNYTVNVQAKVKQLDDFGNFTGFVQNPNGGGDYVESLSATFTTNSGLNNIPDDLLATSFPLHSNQAVQRGFANLYPQFIQTKRVINANDFAFMNGSASNTHIPIIYTLNYFAKLYKNGVFTGQIAPVTQTGDQYVLNTDFSFLDDDGSNNYRIELWASKTGYFPGAELITAITPTTNSTNRYIASFAQTNQTTLNDINTHDAVYANKATNVNIKTSEATALSSMIDNGHLITAVEFTTSKYLYEWDKLNNMRIKEIGWNGYGVKISRDNSPLMNLWYLAEVCAMTSTPDGVMHIPNALNYIVYESDEPFSQADLNSTTSDQVFLPSPRGYQPLYTNSPIINTSSDVTVKYLVNAQILTNDKALDFIAEACAIPRSWFDGNIVAGDFNGYYNNYASFGSNTSTVGKKVNLQATQPATSINIVSMPLPYFTTTWTPVIYVTNIFQPRRRIF